MNTKKIDGLKRLADRKGWEYRNDYSGRFMFGDRCVGICGPSATDIIEAAARIGVKNASVDSMGLDQIVYSRHLQEVE
jgi:hypothetical protein